MMEQLEEGSLSRIIEMAGEYRTLFEAIKR